MSTFVLVHGAWHGSWCWHRVRDALQDLGHRVFTPTLTGVGERSHLLSRSVSLETHIDDVVNLLRWEALTDIVLCGHSYGGCVVTGVADRMPERIRSLVYLDAFVPANGQCLYDLLPEDQLVLQQQLTKDVGEGWKVPPIPAAAFNVNLADRAWVDRQCTMQPAACFTEPLRLNNGALPAAKIHYVLASGYTGSLFTRFHEQAQRSGWRCTELPGGHDLMLDCPELLTKLLAA
jgi:pimeloyl-ACP methyl ester carboxylesterase